MKRNKMLISAFFERVLLAPLSNIYNQWGAYGYKGDIFLRVWADEVAEVKDLFGKSTTCVQVLKPEWRTRNRAGYVDREKHIREIIDGVPGYVVVVTAKDVNADPRHILFYNETYIFPIKRIRLDNGIYYADVGPAIAIADFQLRPVA